MWQFRQERPLLKGCTPAHAFLCFQRVFLHAYAISPFFIVPTSTSTHIKRNGEAKRCKLAQEELEKGIKVGERVQNCVLKSHDKWTNKTLIKFPQASQLLVPKQFTWRKRNQ